MSMYAFISKSVGGVRIGLGKRLGATRHVCHGLFCKYRIRVLTLGSVAIIIATSLPPRAGVGFIVFATVLGIGWLATREGAPAESAPEAATPAASTPTRAEERLAAIMHPKD
jgi:hypothetical protein